MVTAVALLLLLNDKCKPESLQRDGRPGWRFPQTAGCKARTCFELALRNAPHEASNAMHVSIISGA